MSENVRSHTTWRTEREARMHHVGMTDGLSLRAKPRSVKRRYREAYMRGFIRGTIRAIAAGENTSGRLL